MLNIAVCDDEKLSVDKLVFKINEYCAANDIAHSVCTYNSGEELISADVDRLDIIFLDVDMGEINGIETAKEIRKTNKNVMIIYASGYVQYAPAGYQVKAFAYMLKNDIDVIFDSIMDDAIEELNLKKNVFKIKLDGKDEALLLDDIIFIESFDKNIDVHISNGEKHTAKAQINDIYSELKTRGFLQIHKSYIVNMQHVTKIKNYIVTLSNGRELMASQRRWKDIVSDYLEWKGRM